MQYSTMGYRSGLNVINVCKLITLQLVTIQPILLRHGQCCQVPGLGQSEHTIFVVSLNQAFLVKLVSLAQFDKTSGEWKW